MTRTRSLPWTAPAALALLALAAPTLAQQQNVNNLPVPRMTALSPTGARVGTTVEVGFTGTDLDEAERLVFSHPGIKADPVIPPAPAPDPKKPPAPAGTAKPVISKFKVTVAANVPVGNHDVRLVGKWGVSNARTFVVGDLAEVDEKEPNNDLPQAQKIDLNTTAGGNLASPTDVDYYLFSAKKGQRVILSCLASSIDSRMTPGIDLYDSRGKLLGQNRNYSGRDALLDLVVPEDGDYAVRVYEFTHTAGNAEYFYRLSVSTAPWIDAVHPPMVEPGKATQVTVYGRNLPGGKPDPTAVVDGAVLDKAVVTVNPPAAPEAQAQMAYGGHVPPPAGGLDGFELRLKNGSGSSGGFLLTYARAPVVVENADNDTAEKAQEVTAPCEIAGRVEKRRDRDWFTFTAKKGAIFSIDLFSDRIGAGGDVYLVLRNPASKQTIVEQDDNPDMMSPKFFARTDDPATYRFVVPEDGKYQVLVASRTAGILYGPRNYYRLRIAPEAPDFRLVALGPDGNRPNCMCVRPGGNDSWSVFAFRQDGCNEEITLTVEGLPPGLTCPAQTLAGNLRHALLVVSATPAAAPWSGEVKIRGTATINAKQVVREVRAGGVTWPVQQGQGVPTVSRLDRGMFLAVRDKAPYGLTATLDKPEIAQGDRVNLKVQVARHSPDFKGPIQVSAFQNQGQYAQPMPQNLTVTQTTIQPNQNDVQVAINVNPNTPPGVYNLVLRSSAQVPFNKDPMAKQKQNTPVAFPTSAVTLTILPKSLARVSLGGPPNLKPGATGEMSVRVERQFNYDDDYKVELVLPPGVTGVSAAPVVIPRGQNEVKLALRIDPNAAPGNRANLGVRVTATFLKRPVVQESQKFNLNVVK